MLQTILVFLANDDAVRPLLAEHGLHLDRVADG
jgi:hypothetical protein